MEPQQAALWLSLISLCTFVGSLAALPWLVARIPSDYFNHNERYPAPWKNRHPLLRYTLIFLKNLLGLVLVTGGFIMLFLPGQGLLTLAMGLLLLDYPGKFRFERWLVSRRPILRGLNWLRRRQGMPALEVPLEAKPPN